MRLTAAFAAGRIGGLVSIWIIGAKAWAGLDALSLVSALATLMRPLTAA